MKHGHDGEVDLPAFPGPERVRMGEGVEHQVEMGFNDTQRPAGRPHGVEQQGRVFFRVNGFRGLQGDGLLGGIKKINGAGDFFWGAYPRSISGRWEF